MENKDQGKYDDIINLPRYTSEKRAKMSIYDRAAQFSPFAALTGYDDEVIEVARITERHVELCDEKKTDIDRILYTLDAIIDSKPLVSLTYFVSDERKPGGKHYNVRAHLMSVDHTAGTIHLSSGETIAIGSITSLVPDILVDIFE